MIILFSEAFLESFTRDYMTDKTSDPQIGSQYLQEEVC